MSVIPKIPRAPYQGSTLDQLGTLSGPQTPRLLTPPLTINPGSAPDHYMYKEYFTTNQVMEEKFEGS